MTKYLVIQKENMTSLMKRHTGLILLLLAMVFITISGFAWNVKSVTITADGETRIVKTHLNSADGVLRDAGITLGSKDAVLLSTTTVQNGTELTVLRAFPVKVIVDGVASDVMTVQTTAQGLADELGYKAPNYVPLGDSQAHLQSGSEVAIARVTSRSVKSYEQPVDVQVIHQRDDTMRKGEQEVVQEGSAGLIAVQEEILYQDGKEIKKQIISQNEIKQMVPTIIKEGTRDVVETSRGVVRYREVLTMEASAYLPGDGDGRGITASGMVAQRGVVAVDPNVIPLGTRLYIPGYGMAIAADTGGAIKGHRIDLLMDSYGEAMEFGRRSIEVYVLQ
ncbi:3D domain-containing protein [Veillonella criceti]|uniref:Cell wall-binding protein yocH n=1 Tax=Veillonella criceti TaxID=103891 RepID=A0A380NHZ6_9FIRM|nr:3D domain-containing protein [Veillonella criceti]SUP40159.1 Cell wall-binding protein yocH precursor [Veillonella criceti]